MPPERPAGTDPPRPGSQRRFYGPKLAGDGRPCSAGRPPWPGLVLAMRGGRGRGIGGLEARRDGDWTAAWRRRWPGDVDGWRRRRPEHPTAAAARHRGQLGSPNPNRRPFIGRRRPRDARAAPLGRTPWPWAGWAVHLAAGQTGRARAWLRASRGRLLWLPSSIPFSLFFLVLFYFNSISSIISL